MQVTLPSIVTSSMGISSIKDRSSITFSIAVSESKEELIEYRSSGRAMIVSTCSLAFVTSLVAVTAVTVASDEEDTAEEWGSSSEATS